MDKIGVAHVVKRGDYYYIRLVKDLLGNHVPVGLSPKSDRLDKAVALLGGNISRLSLIELYSGPPDVLTTDSCIHLYMYFVKDDERQGLIEEGFVPLRVAGTLVSDALSKFTIQIVKEKLEFLKK